MLEGGAVQAIEGAAAREQGREREREEEAQGPYFRRTFLISTSRVQAIVPLDTSVRAKVTW